LRACRPATKGLRRRCVLSWRYPGWRVPSGASAARAAQWAGRRDRECAGLRANREPSKPHDGLERRSGSLVQSGEFRRQCLGPMGVYIRRCVKAISCLWRRPWHWVEFSAVPRSAKTRTIRGLSVPLAPLIFFSFGFEFHASDPRQWISVSLGMDGARAGAPLTLEARRPSAGSQACAVREAHSIVGSRTAYPSSNARGALRWGLAAEFLDRPGVSWCGVLDSDCLDSSPAKPDLPHQAAVSEMRASASVALGSGGAARGPHVISARAYSGPCELPGTDGPCAAGAGLTMCISRPS